MNTTLKSVLDKELNRKEFLIYIGTLLLTVVGVSGLMKAIIDPLKSSQSSTSNGYGQSVYGGK